MIPGTLQLQTAAKYIGLRPMQLSLLVREGYMPAIYRGRVMLFRRSMLDLWLEQQKQIGNEDTPVIFYPRRGRNEQGEWQ